jgi:hypothetical protein
MKVLFAAVSAMDAKSLIFANLRVSSQIHLLRTFHVFAPSFLAMKNDSMPKFNDTNSVFSYSTQELVSSSSKKLVICFDILEFTVSSLHSL